MLFSVESGENIYKMQIEANGCCSPIAANISGNVTLDDLTVSGILQTGGSIRDGAAGTLAGEIEAGATITVTNVTSTAAVAATVAGGLAGIIGKDVTISLLEDSPMICNANNMPISVTGSYAAGGFFGKVLGDCTIDLGWMDKEVLSYVLGNGAFAGQLAGIVDNGATLTVKNGSSINVSVGTPTSATAGGLVGACYNHSSIVLPGDPFEIKGTVAGGSGTAGGVVGEVKDCSMEFSNIIINEYAMISGARVGGIVGYAANDATRLIIDTPTVKGTLKSTSDVGGILGKVESGCAVELQGTVTVADKITGTNVGSIAARQDYSLIYLQEVQGKDTEGNSQLVVPMDGSLPKYDEVYDYGGVFRNQDMGTKLLIGDGTLNNVGVVNNTITEGKLGESGANDAAADLETFAIANFSRGKFGLKAFGESASLSEILAGNYVLYNNADISYDKTGIVTLNRNNTTDAADAFSGSLSGVNKTITITQNSNIIQACNGKLGVFSSLGNATFSNLIIDGTVKRAAYVGGLAYRTTGNALTINDVQMKKIFEDCATTGAIGGVLVKEECGELFTLNATNLTLASNITAASNANISGFINSIENAEVNLNTISLGGKIDAVSTLQSAAVGGFLGREWKETGGTIKNVTVQNGTSYKTPSKFGCLIHTVSNRQCLPPGGRWHGKAVTDEECGRSCLDYGNLSDIH